MTDNSPITFDYAVLASRSAAAACRRKAAARIQANGKVVFDFSGVRTVAEGFADELLGILALRLGRQQFIDRVRIINATEPVTHDIVDAIEARLAREAKKASSAASTKLPPSGPADRPSPQQTAL